MIFPQHDYKEFNNTNKSEWAIQPATWDNWCLMVKNAQDYCKSVDLLEFKGKCEYWQLPSFHPWWKLQSFKNQIELVETTISNVLRYQNLLDSGNNPSLEVNIYSTMNREQELANELYKRLCPH